MTNKMTNKYIKIICSTLIVGTFLFIAFGSDESKSSSDDSNSNSSSNSSTNNSSTPKSNDGSDTWIPDGYQKGSSCGDCGGSGHQTYHMQDGTPYSGTCPGCNGRGYKTEKK